MKRFIAAVAMVMLHSSALAVPPDEQLSDPVLEAKAREISKGLRCLVCQNQSIDDSDADLAKDLRRVVRERLTAGDDEAAINDYVVERYGEFILLKPRLNSQTLILWGSPLILVLLGLGVAGYSLRRQSREAIEIAPQSAVITPEAQDVLDELRGQ